MSLMHLAFQDPDRIRSPIVSWSQLAPMLSVFAAATAALSAFDQAIRQRTV